MKLFLKSVTVATVISIIFSLIPFSARCENVSEEVFRLHIIANSDSDADQKLKLKVRDKILECTELAYSNAVCVEDAQHITSQMLQKIADLAQQEVYDNGYDYKVKAQICNMYFNTRYYENVTMPSGNYNALRITIGEGKGKNWWCVMYPSLCIGTATDYDALKSKVNDDEYRLLTEEKVEYKFKVVEYFEKICSLFS